MNLMDDQAREWLEKHAHQLSPEELPSEEEKMEAADKNKWTQSNGTWPIPKIVQDIGVFAEACTQDGFDRIVSDPSNWEDMLSRQDLYEQWILPNAVLLFSKVWFDRVKWKNSIKSGVPFPLFNRNDKSLATKRGISLEETQMGKSIIANIINKSSYALRVYLAGKWRSKRKASLRKPGAYIIEAIRNDLIQQIGMDLGYKLKPVLSCPFCLSSKNKKTYKTPLVEQEPYKFTCPKCSESAINHAMHVKALHEKGEDCSEAESLLKKTKTFSYFTGITCICPSDNCSGKFVPIEFANVEKSEIDNILTYYSPVKGTQAFREPPENFKHVKFTCPYCNIGFIPSKAMELKSGFKNKSGFFTGLPRVLIWKNSEMLDIDSDFSITDKLTAEIFDPDFQIMAKQKLDIIIDALILSLSRANKDTLTGLLSWHFYMAAIKWTLIYWEDAFKYFFGWKNSERRMTACEMLRYPGEVTKKVTKVLRGQEVSIHQSFFKIWMDVLEENIDNFKRMGIYELKDFKWFCHRPKFSAGPLSTFRSVVNNRNRIPNMSNVSLVAGSGPKPRLARIISIYKVEKGVINRNFNYLSETSVCEWQAVKLKSNTSLKLGDHVRVEAIMLPGHHSHAPIQRILRLRSSVLDNVICRVLKEESTGVRDNEYWDRWNDKVSKAKEKVLILKRSKNGS